MGCLLSFICALCALSFACFFLVAFSFLCTGGGAMSSRSSRPRQLPSFSSHRSRQHTRKEPKRRGSKDEERREYTSRSPSEEHSDHMEEHQLGRWRNNRASPSPLDGDCLRCSGLVYLVGADRSTYCLDCLEATNELAEGAPSTPKAQPTPTPIFPTLLMRTLTPWSKQTPGLGCSQWWPLLNLLRLDPLDVWS